MASSIRQVFGVSRRQNSLSFPRLATALGYHVRMDSAYIVFFFLNALVIVGYIGEIIWTIWRAFGQ